MALPTVERPERTPVAKPPSRRALRLWLVVGVFIAVGVARSLQVGIPFRDPEGAFLRGRVILTLAIFVGLVFVDGWLRAARPRGVGRVWATIRGRWTPARLAWSWVALLAYHATYFTYHNLKSWDVFNVPQDATKLFNQFYLFFF